MESLGEKTRLRPLEERDLDARARWVADPEIAELMGVRDSESPDTPEEWRTLVARWFQSRRAVSGVYLFAIEDISGKLIGDIERTQQILIEKAKPYSGTRDVGCFAGGTPNDAYGYGVVDAYAAVQAALAVK
jgi:RimJ/RimL family protein N-acetyltransferase